MIYIQIYLAPDKNYEQKNRVTIIYNNTDTTNQENHNCKILHYFTKKMEYSKNNPKFFNLELIVQIFLIILYGAH